MDPFQQLRISGIQYTDQIVIVGFEPAQVGFYGMPQFITELLLQRPAYPRRQGDGLRIGLGKKLPGALVSMQHQTDPRMGLGDTV